jgi:ABC-type branched-subunit amino acid transport system substrate-binding protein
MRVHLLLQILIILIFSYPVSAKTYYIGASIPLSGPYADEGIDMKNALSLYAKKLNWFGGINNAKIEIIFEDDQNKSELAEKIAIKFSQNINILAVVGHQFSSVAERAGKIYKKNGLVNISPSASNPAVLKNNPWLFSMNFHDNTQGEFLAVYLNAILQKQKVLVFTTDDTYGKGLLTSFSNKISKTKSKIVQIITIKDEQKIDDSIFNELNPGLDYDSIIIFSHTSQGIKLVNQLYRKEKNKNIPIIGPDSFSKIKFARGIKSAKQNIYFTSPFFYELSSLETAKFSNLYKKEFSSKNETRPGIWAAFCYDAIHMISKAIESGNTEREKIRDFLASHGETKFIDGITGRLSFDKNGAMHRFPVMGIIKKHELKPAFIQIKKGHIDKTHNLDKKIANKEILLIDNTPYNKVNVIYTGIDFIRINKIDLLEQNFELEFFLWFRHKGNINLEDIDFTNRINKEEDKVEILRRDLSKPVKYTCYKIKQTFLFPFELKHFPFDSQKISMKLAHKNKDASQIMLVVDSGNLSHAELKEIYPEEWEYIKRVDFSGTYEQYSTLGDPNYIKSSKIKNKVEFSVYETRIILKRILFPYLVNLFMPLIIMIVISLMLFLIPLEQFDARIGLVMTALLSVLVFHMTKSESLPRVGYLIKADLYFIVSYVCLFQLIVNTIMTNLLLKNKKTMLAENLEKSCTALFIISTVLSYIIVSFVEDNFTQALGVVAMIEFFAIVLSFWLASILVKKRK